MNRECSSHALKMIQQALYLIYNVKIQPETLFLTVTKTATIKYSNKPLWRLTCL